MGTAISAAKGIDNADPDGGERPECRQRLWTSLQVEFRRFPHVGEDLFDGVPLTDSANLLPLRYVDIDSQRHDRRQTLRSRG